MAGALFAAAMGIVVVPSGHASMLCTEDAMIVFDGSGSMSEAGYGSPGIPRIVAARQSVRDVVPEISDMRRLGLIIYGPGDAGGCRNTDVRFPPTRAAGARVIADIDRLVPDGNTPLTAAVEQAASVLDYRRKPGAIVLITDGAETCFGQPCRLADRLAADGHDLTIHVIGFQIRGEFYDQLSAEHEDYMRAIAISRCLSDRTGGTFATADSTEELSAALRESLGCPVVSRPSQALEPGQEPGSILRAPT